MSDCDISWRRVASFRFNVPTIQNSWQQDMDRFTRNYSIGLGAIIMILLGWVLYEDPLVGELNDQLENQPMIAGYPYPFRVLRVQNSVAFVSTPRSVAFPVIKALPIMYPKLATRNPEDPAFREAQQHLALTQKQIIAFVSSHPQVKAVNWELDRDWLIQRGAQLH